MVKKSRYQLKLNEETPTTVEEQLAFEGFGKEVLPENKVVNVASVPQRSPFRYPGGKTWLIPEVRKWLKQDGRPVKLLHEPFAGGGIVSLTAVAEQLAKQALMIELDNDIYAVWATIFGDNNNWLARRILQFEFSVDTVRDVIHTDWTDLRDKAFVTILKNRTYHGGILAKGSGFLKHGENGKGIASRWYPKTLHDRIIAIDSYRNSIEAIQGNAFDFLNDLAKDATCYHFIDPPYYKAGKRLYTHFDINHEQLFEHVSQLSGKYLLTYDDNPEIRKLVAKYGLESRTIPMKTTHHFQKEELLISDNFNWLE